MDKHLVDAYLNKLRRMRNTTGLLDAAYDWLNSEIAQLEREYYGRSWS